MRSIPIISALVSLVAFAWPPDIALAATSDTGDIAITIQSIDSFDVSSGGTIVLSGTAGSNAMTGPDDTTAQLNYSHNSPTPKKITAEVQPGDNPAGHNITLKVKVTGGAGRKTLVLRGTAQGPVDVVTDKNAGKLSNKTVAYRATCTASGTQVGADTDFVFTVTFTTTD